MRTSIDETVTALLVQRAHTEPQNMSAVYERVAPALYGWLSLSLRGGLRARVDAEELAQETWLRALRDLGEFDSSRGSFRAWIFGIARHVLLEAFRGLRSRLVGSSSTSRIFALSNCPDTVTSVTRRVAREDALQHFLTRVGELDPEEQVLVMCCGLEGQSTVEAALRLGISQEAARKRWQRLRQTLGARDLPDELLAPEQD